MPRRPSPTSAVVRRRAPVTSRRDVPVAPTTAAVTTRTWESKSVVDLDANLEFAGRRKPLSEKGPSSSKARHAVPRPPTRQIAVPSRPGKQGPGFACEHITNALIPLAGPASSRRRQGPPTSRRDQGWAESAPVGLRSHHFARQCDRQHYGSRRAPHNVAHHVRLRGRQLRGARGNELPAQAAAW